jgi:hypothetical protein
VNTSNVHILGLGYDSTDIVLTCQAQGLEFESQYHQYKKEKRKKNKLFLKFTKITEESTAAHTLHRFQIPPLSFDS